MKFLLDHDVATDITRILINDGHEVSQVREVMTVRASDDVIFDYAQQHQQIVITCNRDDFLRIAEGREHRGVIILIRRRSRQAECASLLRLLHRAGESGLIGNINFA
jgi:predicted nuclease of predicted toxin-antitoxin system